MDYFSNIDIETVVIISASLVTIVGAIVGIIWWGIVKPISFVKVKFAVIDTRLDGMDRQLDKIEKSIRMLVDGMRGKKISEASSPISLTKYGVELKKKINVDALIVKYSDELEIPNEWNEYQIQQACLDFADNSLLDLFSDDERGLFEKVAFDEGISPDSLLRVCGISLRDHKLESYGRSIENIDKHAPKTPK